MNQKTFCDKLLKVSRTNFSRALHGHSNLTGKTAIRAAQLLGTPVEIWVDKGNSGERMRAWKTFKRSFDDVTV